MSLFLLFIWIMAWHWPVASAVVAGVSLEYWWEETKGRSEMSEWVEQPPHSGTQFNGKCMRQGCTNNRTGADNLCDDHSSKTGTALYEPPKHSPTHPCPIKGCTQTVVYAKLMCWQHWLKVPNRLKIAVYASWNRGNPNNDHQLAMQAAIDSIQKG